MAATHAIGADVTIAIRAEDVVVATERPWQISARNCFPVRVVALVTAEADAIVRCAGAPGGPEWLVRLTLAAVSTLDLQPGREVWLTVQSHSIRVV